MTQTSKKFLSLAQNLIPAVSTSNINIGVAAAIVRNGKVIGKVSQNTERTHCHGMNCSSVHAEVNAVISYFGKDLYYDKKTEGYAVWGIKGPPWFESKY